jgi:GNAT superfamily N-acetyltransferase
MGCVREVDVEGLFQECGDPFVRHQVDPAFARRAWVNGDAAVIDGARPRMGRVHTGPVYTCLGPAAELGPLLAEVASVAPWPSRATVSTVAPVVPWPHVSAHSWHWMLTALTPPTPGHRVEELTEADEINHVLDLANPDSFARPGVSDRVDTWLGVRVDGVLVAVGAIERMPDGTGHLRGVSVLPSHLGRGLGTALSAGLTRRALDESGVATLGVYVDNHRAVGLYERLGYSVVHTFVSGEIRAR